MSEVAEFEPDTISDLINNTDSKNSEAQPNSQKQAQNEKSRLSHCMEQDNRVDVAEKVTRATTVSILQGSNESSSTQIRDLD